MRTRSESAMPYRMIVTLRDGSELSDLSTSYKPTPKPGDILELAQDERIIRARVTYVRIRATKMPGSVVVPIDEVWAREI